MLDIKFIRDNKDLVKEGARKKHIDFDVEKLLAIDDKRKELQALVETKRSEQNSASDRIASVQTHEERQALINAMQDVKKSMVEKEEELKEVMKEWQMLMVQVPNIPDMTVPEGASDAENKEVRTWGEVPTFGFEPKSHIDLALDLDLADFDRGTKVAGFRGYFLKNDGVLLNFAIQQFVTDHIISKGGFTPLLAPSLVRREPFIGTGYLPQSEEDLYKTQDDTYLAGTAEVPTMGYYMNEIIEESQLPIKFLSFSPCFRREAGSHGKQTKGLYRVHEFYKLEQVVLCKADHQESVQLHEELTTNAEEILQALQLPYHVVVNCGGDLGLGQVKKYDIETWIPSEKRFGETHSSSYFHDFQTRRLNIRYRDSEGKMKFAHSLNNTAIASPRILISVLENYQQADGTIKIPEVLRKYMGGREKIEKKS
ncbi:MAG: serS [Candidatus Paceibacter sp.]|jgi:seryl-tRNA synthetase|nr:serS [Candidatus Paceibacter sp.]